MLHVLDLRGKNEVAAGLPRPDVAGEEPVAAVRAILADVRQRGDAAVRECTARFDGVELDDTRIPSEVVEAALLATDVTVVDALWASASSVDSYHRSQLRPESTHINNGVKIRSYFQPVQRAGVYVPGGLAAYPSTVLMTVVPARAAGVSEVVLCVPPGPDGTVAPITLAAAAVAGVDEVYAIGGAQAIAAMAYGTESIRSVDTISGPGNIYVAIAKREVSGLVGISSSFAGPSEVVVVADQSAPVDGVAIDVLVQAEHGPNGLAWVITTDEGVATSVNARIAELLAASPRRREIEATFTDGGYVVIVDDLARAAEVVNVIAPEHLEVMVSDPGPFLAAVVNAGAIFVGPLSAASIGDYVAGPSHVLPTFGSARFGSALTVDDFLKHMHQITVTEEAFDVVGPWVETLASAEGLFAHADSIRLRREHLAQVQKTDSP